MYTYNVSLGGFVPSTGKRGYYNNIARLFSNPHPKKTQNKQKHQQQPNKQNKNLFLAVYEQTNNHQIVLFFWFLVYIYSRSTWKNVRTFVIFKMKDFLLIFKKKNGKRMTP